MTTGKKVLLVLGFGLVFGLPLALFLALDILWAVMSIDELPPPDDDLRVVRLEIPDDQNALTYFQQAIDKLDLPKDDEPEMDSPAPPRKVKPLPGEEPEPNAPPPTRKQRWDALTKGEVEWDQPIADEVLKRTAEALALWKRCLAAPHYQMPQPERYTYNNQLPCCWPHLALANVVSIRSRDRARRGDHEGALGDALKLVRFGQQVETGKGCLVEYLVGLTLKGMGDFLMREQVKTCTLPSARLRHYAAELARYPCVGQGLAHAWRVEYACQVSAIEDICSGEASLADLKTIGAAGPKRGPPGPAVRLLWRGLRVPIFKPNRTRRLFAETMRKMVEDAPKSYKEIRHIDTDEQEFRPLLAVLRGNVIGDDLYRMLITGVRGAHKFKCVANVELAATRTLLAMKAYKLDKGRLPETLEQLVPDYLDAVPIDDFDGKPLRYNAAKKIIYSVGEDLVDGGGMTWDEFIAAERRKLGLDRPDADPDALEQFDEDYCKNPDAWRMPDPAFAIEF
jgi:hypothetical protein